MKNLNYKIILKLLVILFIYIYFPKISFSQELTGLGVAVPTKIDAEVENGEIICTNEDSQFGPCSTEYATSIFGVVSFNSSVEIEVEEEGVYPVIKDGLADVKVNVSGGAISEGDQITSSKIRGVGMKAVINGFVIGTAQESFNSDDTNAVALIPVIINIHPATNLGTGGANILALIRSGLSFSALDSLGSLRYLLAILIVIVSFVLGFTYFGRVVKAGIESMGRNPLAARSIQITVLFNIFLTIMIIGIGLGVAFLILVL